MGFIKNIIILIILIVVVIYGIKSLPALIGWVDKSVSGIILSGENGSSSATSSKTAKTKQKEAVISSPSTQEPMWVGPKVNNQNISGVGTGSGNVNYPLQNNQPSFNQPYQYAQPQYNQPNNQINQPSAGQPSSMPAFY